MKKLLMMAALLSTSLIFASVTQAEDAAKPADKEKIQSEEKPKAEKDKKDTKKAEKAEKKEKIEKADKGDKKEVKKEEEKK